MYFTAIDTNYKPSKGKVVVYITPMENVERVQYDVTVSTFS